MKLPVMSYVLIIIGLAAIVFGFIYGSIQSIESLEGKIRNTRMDQMEIKSSSSSKNTTSMKRSRMEPVLVIGTSKGDFYVREVYKDHWKEIQEESMIGKTISVAYQERGFIIKELLIDGKEIINDEVANSENQRFRYFFFLFGATAFYMAWQIYNKKKIKSQRA